MQSWADLGIVIPPNAPGPEVHATCPKCSPSRKKKTARCLSANIVENVFCCNHCGWSGSLKTGRQDRHTPAWQKPAYTRPKAERFGPLPQHALDWFAHRGIPDWALDIHDIMWGSVYMPQIEDHAQVIVFPYLRNGELINRKYRTLTDKHFRMDTGAERVLYGFDDVELDLLVIVEGEIDKLSVTTAGITSCVSVPDGAPAENTKDYSSKFAFLDSAKDLLDRVKKIIIAVDNDKPGVRLEEELARRLGRERCWRVRWPEGCKDANDVLVKHGVDDLRWFLHHAEPYPIKGVFSTLGESEKIRILYLDGLERGVSTGWLSLDEYYRVRPGELTVVTGVPGSGKSNFVDSLTVNLAHQHGWSFGIFSPENQPLEDHMARMIEKYTRLPFNRGPTPRMSESDLDAGIHWAETHFRWMLPDDEESWDVGWILGKAKELVYRHGIRGLVIDPWNELEPQRHQGETETEYISRVLRTVRQFGRQHGVHVWMVVHPTKLPRDEKGQYPVPTLYDASGSAHWRNKADNGLSIWRDFSSTANRREVEVHIQKIRFRQIGRLGKVTLVYDPPTARYDEST